LFNALVSWSDRVDSVGASISFNHDPHPAPLKVLPGLQYHSIEIFALEYGLKPFGFRSVERRILN
tara:strand:- start:502 stop:696 length:195 start_codon:yes stop_codon:yes gene_type:complete